jgi:hypothetical protein
MRSEKWSGTEVEKFHMALSLFGTDFSMIENVFDGQRTRAQIKVSLHNNSIE